MGRRIPRDLRPFLEEFERRELLSAITDLMAANSIAAGRKAQSAAATAISSQSIAVSANQGPLLNSNNPDNPINNQALAPTGTLTSRQQRKERFVAHYVGTYTVGAGRNQRPTDPDLHHGRRLRQHDVALRHPVAARHSQRSEHPIGGVSTIFDRNLNTNTVLGLDLAAPQSSQFINRLGLPSLLPTVSVDVNSSSGTYDEAYSVGHDQYPLHSERQAHPRRSQPGQSDRDDPRSDLHTQRRLHPPQRQHRSLMLIAEDAALRFF